MANKVRDIFIKPPEEDPDFLQLLVDIHTSNVGQCCTCEHYFVDIYTPGFIADPEEFCDLSKPYFNERYISYRGKSIDCPDYKETDISRYREALEKLGGK